MSRSVSLQIDLRLPHSCLSADRRRPPPLLVNGELQPGDTLPTVGSLGLDLGVHFSTVAEAYRTLSAEGWLELRRHHGAFVTERRSPAPAAEAHADFGSSLRQLIAHVSSLGLANQMISKELELLARNRRRSLAIFKKIYRQSIFQEDGMNSSIAMCPTALLGLFYCWTSRINALFFFGQDREDEMQASARARAITRQYSSSPIAGNGRLVAMEWAARYTGSGRLHTMGPLVEAVLLRRLCGAPTSRPAP